MQFHAARTRFVHERSAGILFLCASLIFSILFVLPRAAHAHAMLQKSDPAANASVHPGVVPVVLTFNSRVDAAHSTLSLLLDGKPQPLAINMKAAPNVLRAQTAPLKAGHYVLRWQAVASDGHITRGEVPFDVK
jgi:methionine-rich copper-binding protein CopC